MLVAFGVLLGGALLVLLALPLWFPWALHPVAQRLGIRYQHYEREGYARFVLVGVSFTNQSVRFAAEKIETFTPTLYLWHRTLDREPVAFLRAQNWKLELLQRKQGAAAGPASVYTNVHKLGGTLSKLANWVPKASLTNGAIDASGGLTNTTARAPTKTKSMLQVQLASVTWLKGILSAEVKLPNLQQTGTLQANVAGLPCEIKFRSDSLHLESVARLLERANGLQIESTNLWRSNRIDISAQFGRTGTLPEQASIRSDRFRIPAEALELNNFEDLSGSLDFQWQRNQFTVDLAAAARPRPSVPMTPIDLQLRATGNTQTAFIETAKISAPWLVAELSPGVTISSTRPFLEREARVKVAVNLNRQPWIDAGGKLEGEVLVRPQPDKLPVASWAFSGTGIVVSNVQTKAIALKGNFEWPWLNVATAEFRLADDSGLALNGGYQIQQRLVRDGHLKFDGAFGREFLPAGYYFDRASLDARFQGRLQALTHSGQFTIQNVLSPSLRPLQVRGNWEGSGINLQQTALAVSAGNTVLTLDGSLSLTNIQTRLLLKALTLQQKGETTMALEKPCAVSLGRPQAGGTNWSINLEPFHWQGGPREFAFDGEVGWPDYGHVAGFARSLDLSTFADFVKVLPGQVLIQKLDFSTDWTNGPINLNLEMLVSLRTGKVPFSARASLSGNNKGLSLQQIYIASQTQAVLTANGFLPLTITPTHRHDWLKLLSDQSLQLQVATETNSLFWDEISAATGVGLLDPKLTVNVSGPWQTPRGNIQMQVQQIKLPRAARGGGGVTNLTNNAAGLAALKLEHLRLTLELDRQTANLNQLDLLIDGQPMTLTAQMPLGPAFWAAIEARKPRLNWENVSARLKMKDAQVAAFARLIPRVLTPQGTLNLDLGLLPGGKLTGDLSLSGASTQPLGSFGVVRDIELRMSFLERAFALKSIKASLGGAPISASGRVDLSGTEWLKGTPPPFQLKLHGENLPLARSPDFVVRSDIEASISKTQAEAPLISGLVRLRDSFYLHDLKDLLPGGVSSPGSRPPYFSIELEPLANWRLNLDLKGERFLKVNSPLFRGVASAGLKLTGTLKAPLALGNVKIDSGQVQFPFTNLEVTQGLVTLTSDNPYRPQLLVSAGSRRAGYDVKMELSGPADQPVVQFSSTPPLSSEQIVLMLTAGELPKTEFTLSPQQRAQTLAMYVGKNLLSKFGFSPQSERLSIQSGENISETGSLTYRVEYKLSSRWYLVGEYDRFNAFNFGLKWRIYSK